MGGAESLRPEDFFSRDTGDLPLELNLNAPGWSLVTPQGANQRGWTGPPRVDPAQIERLVASAVAEAGAVSVDKLTQSVAGHHGEVPEHAVLEAVEKLRQADRLMTYTGQPQQEDRPDHLIHGTSAILHTVQHGDVIITPAEASKRGWVRVETPQFKLAGHAGAEALLALLPRLGSLYARGATSTVKSLDLWDLDIQGGGRLRLTLEGVPPAAMKQLGEFFEVLATVVKAGQHTEAELEIDDPEEACLFMQALQRAGEQ